MLNFHRPVHPGEILREEFLAPLNLTPYTLAKQLHIQRDRLERIVREKSPITTDTALRLARYFGNSARFWVNLQTSYDLEVAQKERRAEIDEIVPREDAVA